MCTGPKPGPFDSFDDSQWEKAFEMCLLSYVRTIRACLPSMRRLGGGRIVNSTSSSVKDCLDNLILSNTMRMGVVGMSKTLASELGKDNILINVIGPGRIGTARITSLNAMRAEKAGITVEEYEKEDLKSFPLGRYGTTEEYGRLAVFLCSEANTYISGQTILLDGGMTRAYQACFFANLLSAEKENAPGACQPRERSLFSVPCNYLCLRPAGHRCQAVFRSCSGGYPIRYTSEYLTPCCLVSPWVL